MTIRRLLLLGATALIGTSLLASMVGLLSLLVVRERARAQDAEVLLEFYDASDLFPDAPSGMPCILGLMAEDEARGPRPTIEDDPEALARAFLELPGEGWLDFGEKSALLERLLRLSVPPPEEPAGAAPGREPPPSPIEVSGGLVVVHGNAAMHADVRRALDELRARLAASELGRSRAPAEVVER